MLTLRRARRDAPPWDRLKEDIVPVNDKEMNVNPEAGEPRPDQGGTEPAEQSETTDPYHPSRHVQMLADHFRRSLAAEGADAYRRWGLAFFYSLEDEEAEAQREARGFDPQDALGHYNRGCLLAGREDFAAAVKSFAQAVKLDPELPEALFNLALAQEQAGHKADARRSWNQFIELFGDREEVAEIREHLAAQG